MVIFINLTIKISLDNFIFTNRFIVISSGLVIFAKYKLKIF